MSERRINLEEILKENLNLYIQYWLSKAEYRKEFIINAMKEAIKQALELAAENATVRGNNFVRVVDKQSIIDTINQII